MPSSRRSAFTLVELLVVVGIIGVLVAIVIGVAASVAEGGRARATEGVLRALDQSLDIFVEQRGGIPDALIAAPPGRLVGGGALAGQAMYYPLVDGVVQTSGSGDFVHNQSVGIYLLDAEQIPEIQSIIAGLDTSLVRRTRLSPEAGEQNTQSAIPQVELTTVLDAWGNPVRMVHPRFHGLIRGDGPYTTVGLLPSDDNPFLVHGELPGIANRVLPFRRIRRLAPTREEWAELTPAEIEQHFAGAVGDSDGGLCPTPRPYFYSAGPDGDPATIDDNVYTTRPRFPEARD